MYSYSISGCKGTLFSRNGKDNFVDSWQVWMLFRFEGSISNFLDVLNEYYRMIGMIIFCLPFFIWC